jgi:hypothetical protein
MRATGLAGGNFNIARNVHPKNRRVPPVAIRLVGNRRVFKKKPWLLWNLEFRSQNSA